MSIFISYSHEDKYFVDRLALSLVAKRIPVFVDRWEMKVGESLTKRIETAITDASYLIIVLSKNSINSDWCKREITSGLVLELENKRVMILPVLLEDCEIPLFLRDKYYADFRSNFESGFKSVLEAVADLGSEERGAIRGKDIFTDYSTSHGMRGNYFEFQIDLVEYSILENSTHTLLVNIVFVGNKNATERYKKQLAAGTDWLMPYTIILLCAEDKKIVELNAHIVDAKPYTTFFNLKDLKNDISFTAYLTVKPLGLTDGKDKLYYIGNIFTKLWDDIKSRPHP